jgi:hypothetical protein
MSHPYFDILLLSLFVAKTYPQPDPAEKKLLNSYDSLSAQSKLSPMTRFLSKSVIWIDLSSWSGTVASELIVVHNTTQGVRMHSHVSGSRIYKYA